MSPNLGPIDSRAYESAIECAALCMIALGSANGGEFREQMREAFREALALRGALHDAEVLVNKFEARNVLNDIVTRVMMTCSGELVPTVSMKHQLQIGENAELALSQSLHAVLAKMDEMCLSGQ
jgi:hypothetical protein